MNKRTMDEIIANFNQEVSKMDIAREYKIALLGMITAIGYESKKQDIVRCKDCKFQAKCPTKIFGNYSGNWFCADGEVKKDEQTI